LDGFWWISERRTRSLGYKENSDEIEEMGSSKRSLVRIMFKSSGEKLIEFSVKKVDKASVFSSSLILLSLCLWVFSSDVKKSLVK